MTARTATDSRLPLLVRIAAAVFGGYAFAWGLIALAIPSLYGAGMAFHDAEHLASIVAFLVYLTAFCWAFVARSLARVWIVLAGGGAAMAAAGTFAQHLILR
ncbi:iron uptake protein [Dokdonella sp. MW10]|uniref:iron uptake protein n=1 Tax=Dokdonella sp. MW10 TaxID=2992926 RepID=UPI003F7F4C77